MRIDASTNRENRREGRLIVRRALERTILAALAVFLASVAGAASTEGATELFGAARGAFQRGEYDAALELYEAAAEAGLQGAVVDFNIGVAAYRAGNLDRAEQAFIRAAQSSSMSALSYYNLGLVAQARGDHDAARELFSRVVQSTDDERLRNLALRQLGSEDVRARTNWGGYLSAGFGHDDNVALAPDSDVLEVSGRDDAFAEAQGGLAVSLDSHWRIEGGLDQIDYLDLDEFDLLSTYAAARHRFTAADWTHEARAQITYSRVGGDSFETRRAISFQSTRDLNSEWLFRARYRFSRLEGLGSYDALDGTRHEVQARFVYDPDWARLTMALEYELNDQESAFLASDRQEVQVLAERELTPEWVIEAELALQRSQYDEGGSDTLMDLGLTLARALNSTWRVVGRYTHSRNESDDAVLDYDLNQIFIGAEVGF